MYTQPFVVQYIYYWYNMYMFIRTLVHLGRIHSIAWGAAFLPKKIAMFTEKIHVCVMLADGPCLLSESAFPITMTILTFSLQVKCKHILPQESRV